MKLNGVTTASYNRHNLSGCQATASVLAVAFIGLLLFPLPCRTQDSYSGQAASGDTRDYVYDYAGLFTDAPPILSKVGRVGRVCKSQNECGPNEECRPIPHFRRLSTGICECRRCYGFDLMQHLCVPMSIKTNVCNRRVPKPLERSTAAPDVTPGSSGNEDDNEDKTFYGRSTTEAYYDTNATTATESSSENVCKHFCEPLSGTELYPPNAQCSGDGRVVCTKCHAVVNNQCVAMKERFAKQSFGETCSSDCQCSSDLKCRPTCQCPFGQRWHKRRKRCVFIKTEFGSFCETDAECGIHSDNPDLRYASRAAAICVPLSTNETNGDHSGDVLPNSDDSSSNETVENNTTEEVNGTCGCQQGFETLGITMISSRNGQPKIKVICVSKGFRVVSQGSVCNVDPIAVGDVQQASSICETPTVCYSCPEGYRYSFLGRCRTVLPFTDVQRVKNQATTWTKWTGQVCRRDSECTRFGEICVKPPVEPPCEQGYCSCPPNFDYGRDGHCAEIRRLELGVSCYGAKNERYPRNSGCAKNFSVNGGIVVCNDNFKAVDSMECVEDHFSKVGYGMVCAGNCKAGLVCGGMQRTARTCQCPLTNQHWHETAKRCRLRHLGETCSQDAECDASDPPRKRLPAGRICNQQIGRCMCDDAFSIEECLWPRKNDNEWEKYRVNLEDDYFYSRNDYDYCKSILPTESPVASGDGNLSMYSEAYYLEPSGGFVEPWRWSNFRQGSILSGAVQGTSTNSLVSTTTVFIIMLLLFFDVQIKTM